MSAAFVQKFQLFRATPQGGAVHYRIDFDRDGHGTHRDPVLVSRTADGWAPVDRLESSVDRSAMEGNYGTWWDSEVPYGPVESRRSRDGICQDDEVTPFRFGEKLGTGHDLIGTEIVVSPEPALEVHQHPLYFGYRADSEPYHDDQQQRARDNDIYQAKRYAWDDGYWKVPLSDSVAQRNPFKS